MLKPNTKFFLNRWKIENDLKLYVNERMILLSVMMSNKKHIKLKLSLTTLKRKRLRRT
jgi:hypothetical protein